MDSFVYEYDYYYAGVTSMIPERIPEILGKADAADEWTDPISADANFIRPCLKKGELHKNPVYGIIGT